VKEIVVSGGSQDTAIAAQSITLVLEDEVDASRGDVIATAAHPIERAHQFEADLLWMSEHADFEFLAQPGRALVSQPDGQAHSTWGF
jgi:sulfate adenylyltransferase subunit 1 (EFTu-like GTPase family)